MKWLRERKWITAGFIATLTMTGAMSFTSYQNSLHLVRSANQVQKTNDLLDALTDISVILAHAESRQWSYLLFDDPNELEEYGVAVDQLNTLLPKIRQPLADTLIQQQRLSMLEYLIYERLQLFEQAIAHYQEQSSRDLSAHFLLRRTQENFKELRQIITELEQTEEELIALQIEAVQTNSRIRMVIEPAATILTFSILLGVFGLLYRQSLKRQHAEAAQQALTQQKELSELKLQLFSMVSHEFRTPLSLILGSSQLLEESLKNSVQSSRLKSLYRIQSSAKVMTQLLNDILMVSRADAGALELTPKWIEIQTFCLNLIEDFQVSHFSISHLSKQVFSFHQWSDRTHAYVDEKLLYSILSNLLSNAVKFSPPSSTIHLTLLSQPDAIVFQVRDEGIGIPEEEQSRLYEPFIRGKNVQNISGTGLGLSVVQRCLALHGGTLSLSSKVNLGTIFTVTIPQPDLPSAS